MIQLLLYFFELLSFKRDASFAPKSASLLTVLLILEIFASGLMRFWFQREASIEHAILASALLCLCIAGVLGARNQLPRLIQTLVAYFGASFWLSFIGVFLAFSFDLLGHPKTGPIPAFFGLGILGLMVWNWLLLAHILRASANWSWLQTLTASAAINILLPAALAQLSP